VRLSQECSIVTACGRRAAAVEEPRVGGALFEQHDERCDAVPPRDEIERLVGRWQSEPVAERPEAARELSFLERAQGGRAHSDDLDEQREAGRVGIDAHDGERSSQRRLSRQAGLDHDELAGPRRRRDLGVLESQQVVVAENTFSAEERDLEIYCQIKGALQRCAV